MRRAVDRNRAKRQCRAACAEVLKDTPLSSVACTVHVKSAALRAPYAALVEDLRALLSSASREVKKRSTISQ